MAEPWYLQQFHYFIKNSGGNCIGAIEFGYRSTKENNRCKRQKLLLARLQPLLLLLLLLLLLQGLHLPWCQSAIGQTAPVMGGGGVGLGGDVGAGTPGFVARRLLSEIRVVKSVLGACW